MRWARVCGTVIDGCIYMHVMYLKINNNNSNDNDIIIIMIIIIKYDTIMLLYESKQTHKQTGQHTAKHQHCVSPGAVPQHVTRRDGVPRSQELRSHRVLRSIDLNSPSPFFF